MRAFDIAFETSIIREDEDVNLEVKGTIQLDEDGDVYDFYDVETTTGGTPFLMTHDEFRWLREQFRARALSILESEGDYE